MNRNELVRGNLSLMIIRIIQEKGETYGYEIQQELEALSEGEVNVTYGSLYPALHKLKAKGLISTREDTSGSRKRVFYRITEQGKETAATWMDEWIRFFRFMIKVLDINPKTLQL